MDRVSIHQNEMFVAVLVVMAKYKQVWEKIPVMNDLEKELETRIAEIKETARLAGVAFSGVTDDKKNTVEQLSDVIYDLAAALTLYGRRNNKADWVARFDLSDNQLDRLRQADVLRLAEDVLDVATKSASLLTSVGVREDEISLLKELTARYSTLIPTTKVSQSERKAANEKLDKLVPDTARFLKEQVDKGLKRFSRTAPEFYNEYVNVRKVVDRGVRHEKDNTNGAADTKAA
jgi:hypothetical protein